MNEKENILLNLIINYFSNNITMPTRRYLQKKMGFKSVNSITQYLKSLETKNYLRRNSENKLVLDNYTLHYKDVIKNIKIINDKNKFIHMILDNKKNYYGYKMNNNYFNYLGICKNDILIIEEKTKLKDNEIGLFIIDSKYRVMRYLNKNGFFILKDCDELILSKVKILGKVILVEKKL